MQAPLDGFELTSSSADLCLRRVTHGICASRLWVLSETRWAAWALDGQHFRTLGGVSLIMRESVAVKHSAEPDLSRRYRSQLHQEHRYRQALRAALPQLVAQRLPSRRCGRRHSRPALRSAPARRRVRQARAAQQHAQIFRRREQRALPGVQGVQRCLPETSASPSHIEQHFGTNLDGTYLRVEIRAGHRRLLARAAHRPRRQAVHDAALHVEGPEPRAISAPTSTMPTRSTSAARPSRATRRLSSCPPTSPITASSSARSTACASR